MKKRISILCYLLLLLSYKVYSQENFHELLYLKKLGKYGTIYGSENKNWKLPDNSKTSLSDDKLCGHILPKMVIDPERFVVTLKELEHFAELSDIEIEYTGKAVCVPEHWEGDKFKTQIQTLHFKEPLKALIINDEDIQSITLDSIIGERFFTFYPEGSYEDSAPKDDKSNPIAFRFPKQILKNANMILLISDHAYNNLSIKKINICSERKVKTYDTETKDIRLTTKVDIDNNGEPDIILFKDKEILGGEAHDFIFIAIYNKTEWYRTAYSEIGQDGVEGF